jgi:hypothetical protein
MSSKSSDDLTMAQLPAELTDGLMAMIRRVRRIILVRGMVTSVVVLLACALAIMAIDAGVTIFSSAVRWLLSLCALAIVVATALRSLVRPLMRPLSLTRMARVLETRHPELQERISSAIELLAMGGNAAASGSEQLIQLLAHDAQMDMSGVKPRQEFTGRTLKPVVVSAAVVVGIFALLFVVWPRQTSLLFVRAVAPYVNLSDLQGAGLQPEPGDVLRLEGDALTLRLTVKGRAESRAEVHTERESGLQSSERMFQISPEGEQPVVYELNYPTVTKSFRYRMRYGAGLTRYYSVTVLPPPAATRMTITTRYPDYTRKADLVLPEGARDIVGAAGGSVTIEADFNRETEGVLLLGDRVVKGEATDSLMGKWTFNLSTNMPELWALSLLDKNGFTNQVEWASLKVLPDRAPVVTLQTPGASKLSMPPYGLLSFTCSVNEDFGIAKSSLVFDPQGFNTELQRIPLPLRPGGGEYWAGKSDLEIGLLQLGGSRTFKAWIHVVDTRPASQGGPQEARSRVVEVVVDQASDRLVDQARKKDKAEMIALLRKAAEQLTQAAEQVTLIKEETIVEMLPPPVVKALTEAHDGAAGAGALVSQAAAICDGSLFKTLSQSIRWVAGQSIEPARAHTAEISVVLPAKRRTQADTAIKALEKAASNVLGLIERLDEMEKKLAEIAQVEILAERQKDLANQVRKKMTKEEMEKWRQKQKELAEELAAKRELDRKDSELAQQQMEEAQKAMLEKETEDAKEQEAQAKSKDEKTEAKSSDPKGESEPGKKNDGKKPEAKKGLKSKKGKGKGQGKKGKSEMKGKDKKTEKDGDKGKKGKGGEGENPPDPGETKPKKKAREAAETLEKMAKNMKMKKLPPTKQAVQDSKKKGKGGNSRGKGEIGDVVPQFFKDGVPNADWARIKSESGSGSLAEALKGVPPEYRDLVRQYFLELANEGEKNQEQPGGL